MAPPKIEHFLSPGIDDLLSRWKTDIVRPLIDTEVAKSSEMVQRLFDEYKKQKEEEIQLLKDQLSTELRSTGEMQRTQGSVINPTAVNNYSWTTGNDYAISHSRKIAAGATGEVHEVCPVTVVAHMLAM
jgi:hypothetical protein